MLFDWSYADIVVGVLISLWVVPRALKLAGSALRILTQASPANVDVDAVRADLRAVPGVSDVHDLHVWTLTTGMDVATVHLTPIPIRSGCWRRPRPCSMRTASATPPFRSNRVSRDRGARRT